jgi:chromatin assembly factor 1 subunit B
VVTQASGVQASGVVNNPTLIGGNVPGIAATNSAKVTGVPMTTPPETPANSGSNHSSNTASTGGKRDLSESEDKDDSNKEPKKRRIAPTLISGDDGDTRS